MTNTRWHWHPYIKTRCEHTLLTRALFWIADLLGRPGYLVGQTVVVTVWIIVNVVAVEFRWDPYPFILLNLAFSTQASYAAPIILFRQNRDAVVREAVAKLQAEESHDTHQLVEQIHSHLTHESAATGVGVDEPRKDQQ